LRFSAFKRLGSYAEITLKAMFVEQVTAWVRSHFGDNTQVHLPELLVLVTNLVLEKWAISA
jgi:hypothetical protein